MKASTVVVVGALAALAYYVLRRTQSSTSTQPVGSLSTSGTGAVANNNGGPLPMSGSDEMWNSGSGGGGGISITFGW
jgi:hypothetical protein